MRILVFNAGSSSVKYALFDNETAMCSGIVEGIGSSAQPLCHRWSGPGEERGDHHPQTPSNEHSAAVDAILEHLSNKGTTPALDGVAHRVVHGGRHFAAPTVVTEEVLEEITELASLAPLHNDAAVAGIRKLQETMPDVRQIAVFDTAFHHTLPRHAYEYALPRHVIERFDVRKYGFHGISHQYVTRRAAQWLDKPPAELNMISLHLGNGASMAAVRGGQCVDTSMGMTPLEGLIMGSRCGDLDPSIPLYLLRRGDMDMEQLECMLNRDSGLKGLCGLRDMRDVQQAARTGNATAREAIESYCYRIKKYLGAYFAILGKLDAVIFTAGIGENDANIRARVCEGLQHLGLELDPRRNDMAREGVAEIQSETCKVKVLVIATKEELEMARQAAQLLGGE